MYGSMVRKGLRPLETVAFLLSRPPKRSQGGGRSLRPRSPEGVTGTRDGVGVSATRTVLHDDIKKKLCVYRNWYFYLDERRGRVDFFVYSTPLTLRRLSLTKKFCSSPSRTKDRDEVSKKVQLG